MSICVCVGLHVHIAQCVLPVFGKLIAWLAFGQVGLTGKPYILKPQIYIHMYVRLTGLACRAVRLGWHCLNTLHTQPQWQTPKTLRSTHTYTCIVSMGKNFSIKHTHTQQCTDAHTYVAVLQKSNVATLSFSVVVSGNRLLIFQFLWFLEQGFKFHNFDTLIPAKASGVVHTKCTYNTLCYSILV